jgi:hypothetical protein
MKTWRLVLMTRTRRDSATTGLRTGGYQSAGARLLVQMMGGRVYLCRTTPSGKVHHVRPSSSGIEGTASAAGDHLRILDTTRSQLTIHV